MKLKLTSLTLLAIAACHANTITLAVTGLPTANLGGHYEGFATGTIDGVADQLIICDDFTHETNVPSGNMVYDFSTVGGSDPLQNVRFTGSSEVQNYEEAAVLVWQLYNYVTANGSQASASTISDYQYAIWNIFDPYNASTNPNGIVTTTAQANLQTTALNLMSTQATTLATTVYPYVKVYTPDPNGGSASNQEFMQYSAPEPGTFLLLAGGLLMAGAAKMRRELRKRRAA